jgi:Domain of unknown function (DUF6438)
MKNLILAFSTLLFVVACSKKTTVKTTEMAPQKDAPVTVVSPTQPSVVVPKMTNQTGVKAVGIPKDVDENLLASLHRSPCFGRCASFKYELFADGKVAYTGYAYTTRIGNYTTKADDAFMKRIADKALSIKYLYLADHYPTADIAVSDLPTTTTYIRVGADGKKISNNYDPPKELVEFEQWLEAQFETLNWQQAKE